MTFVFYTVHVLVCIFLILVVLLQQGKGADLSVFGGGATQSAFGARGATTVLHKATVASFVLFILTTLAIGIFEGQRGSSTVMGTVPAATATEDGATEASADEAAPAALPEAALPEATLPEATPPSDETSATAVPEMDSETSAAAPEAEAAAPEGESDAVAPEAEAPAAEAPPPGGGV